jgi:hypothetical protein
MKIKGDLRGAGNSKVLSHQSDKEKMKFYQRCVPEGQGYTSSGSKLKET